MEIPGARQTADAAVNADSSVVMNKVIVDALSIAVGNKASTTTISFAGKGGADVMRALQELRQKGFKVTTSGTNFVVSW